jgi:osmotically-inducible protein OsmY
VAAAKVAKVVERGRHQPDSAVTDTSKDIYLASQAKLALTKINISGFDPLRVHVVASAGTVYLLGLVTRAEAEAAAEKVRYVSGVVKVIKLFEYIQAPA